MTPLTDSLTREVVLHDGKARVVRIAPEGVYIREKGKRTEYGPVAWTWIELQGAKQAANAAMQERAATRAARRASR